VQHGEESLNLIIEVTGEKKKEKAAKVATARTLWVPAVNAIATVSNHGGFGLWAFLKIADPWVPKTSSGPSWRPCRRLRFAPEAPLTKAIFVLQCNSK
jgi:hypothetical protein